MQATIDGRTIHAEPGETIYRAATVASISIPSLCASRQLSSYGSCRLCVCEVDGLTGLHAACCMPLQDGMIVRTDSPQLHRHRRNLIELYLSEQPAGEPAHKLSELAKRYGLTKIRYPRERREPPFATSPAPSSRSITSAAFPARAACAPAMRFNLPSPFRWSGPVSPAGPRGAAPG